MASSPTPTGGSWVGWKRFAPRSIRRSTATSSAGHASRCTTSPGTSSATGTSSWPRCSWPTDCRTPRRCWPRCWTRLLKLLHPVMPFVTETLWKALTGDESVVDRRWPERPDSRWIVVAAQRITDMQKLVTEVRRFRSDQGLADRQKVPARLSGIDERRPRARQVARRDVAGVADRRRATDFSPSASVEVRLSGRHGRRRTRHVGHRRRGRRASPPGEGSGRRAEGTGRAPQRNSATRPFWPRPREAVVDKIRDRQRVAARGSRPDHGQAGRAAVTLIPTTRARGGPTPDEIASLLQVEHLLDQRWPETKIEPQPGPHLGADGPARLAATQLSRRSTSPAPTARRRWRGWSTHC